MSPEIKIFEGSEVKAFDVSRLDIAEKKLAERSEGSDQLVVESVLGALRRLNERAA